MMLWYLNPKLLVVLVIFVGAGQTTNPDPCDPAYHTKLNEPYRSSAFRITSPSQIPLCDMHLPSGWYQFNSQPGQTMPMKCPDRLHCGTVVPVWMNGTIPTPSDGVVPRDACANFNNNCCELKMTIGVKNCGGFVIYYLTPTPSCPFAYCAGGDAPCPFGQWSPTMFPPGCRDQFPIMTTNPKLLGPILYGNNSFHFECEVIYPNPDVYQRFEVSWIFDGVEDINITSQIINDTSINAVLDGTLLKGHLNQDLECRVRSYYAGNEANKGPYLSSNAYYPGIQISPAHLVVSENDYAHTVNITSTIPIVCDFNAQCFLTIDLNVSSSSDFAIMNGCTYYLFSTDWDPQTSSASIEIPVVAKQDMIRDGDKQLLLVFKELLPVGGPYMNVFAGYRPPPVQIISKDQDTTICHLVTDPHITGFDYRTQYHLYLVGNFTAVEVAEQHFQVQISTWVCRPGVTCICGIAIREKNDIVRMNQCGQTNRLTTAPIASVPRELGEGTIVQRSTDGKKFGVYLPSGTEIGIDSTFEWINVHITLPGTYYRKAKGICGTNDGVRNNDFTYPNGHVDPVCPRSGTCLPNKFFQAWRVDAADNLFEDLPDLVNVTEEVKYCLCGKESGQTVVNCTTRASKPTGTACPKCIVFDPKPPFAVGAKGRKRAVPFADVDVPDAPYVEQDVPPADPNKQWPTTGGITEAQAQDICTKALARSQLSSKSGEFQELYQASMDNCLADILFSETTDFVDGITSAFTAQTQVTLAKDPANYVSDADGNSVLRAEYLEDICDLQCDEHGQCGQGGECVCDAGWEGANCHIQSGIGPQLGKIRRGPLCDTTERPCEKVFMDVTNVDLTDSLICRVQAVDEHGNDVGRPVDTEAESLSAFRIACGLPVTTVSSQRYKISASNDGSLFGNELTLHVFDSTCMDCDEAGCTVKTTACRISEVCYFNGETSDDDPFKICDVTKDTTDWTILPKPTPSPEPQLIPTSTAIPDTMLGALDACQVNRLSSGIHPHPYDCTKFIMCTGTHTDIMDCPAGLAYDPELEACNYRLLVKTC